MSSRPRNSPARGRQVSSTKRDKNLLSSGPVKTQLKFTTPMTQRCPTDSTQNDKETAQQAWEKKIELDVAYSKYLETLMLEKLMEKNANEVKANVENQLLALHEQFEKKASNINILKQRVLEVQDLNEREKTYDELISRLQNVQCGVQNAMPSMNDLNSKIHAEINKVDVENVVLPTNLEERECLAKNLKKIAAQCKDLFQLEHPAKSELSTLCTKIGEAGNKRKLEIENCQRVLLPQCDLQLASYISHQHTLKTAGKKC